jgi:hypothetical protein
MSFAAVKLDVEGDSHLHHENLYVDVELSDIEFNQMNTLEWFFEIIFFIDMVTNFFKEYQINDSYSTQPVRSFEKIALHYMNG